MQRVAIGGFQKGWRGKIRQIAEHTTGRQAGRGERREQAEDTRDRGAGGQDLGRFQGCCVDRENRALGLDDAGRGKRMGSVKRASPCMVPTSSSQLPRSSHPWPPAACRSCRPALRSFPHIVIRFPHLPRACHLAYPISRFPSLGPQHHPPCSLPVLVLVLVQPHAWPTSSIVDYIPIRFTRTYAPRSRPDHAPHGRCAYLGGRSMACFCRQVASLARLISTVTLHPLERGSWHRGLVSAASPWARTIWPPAVSSPEQDDVPFQTPLAARQPARERPYSHTRPSTLP